MFGCVALVDHGDPNRVKRGQRITPGPELYVPTQSLATAGNFELGLGYEEGRVIGAGKGLLSTN